MKEEELQSRWESGEIQQFLSSKAEDNIEEQGGMEDITRKLDSPDSDEDDDDYSDEDEDLEVPEEESSEDDTLSDESDDDESD